MTAGDRRDPAAAAAFEGATLRYRDDPEVTPGTCFGKTPGLRVGGRIFAMLGKDGLIVKLPVARIDALLAEIGCERVEMRGRRMREWARVPLAAGARWPELVGESYAFVRSGAE